MKKYRESKGFRTIHIWRPWKLSNLHNPYSPCPATSKILLLPWPWTSNFKRTPLPLQMITSQLKASMIQGWLLYDIRSFLLVDFVFSVNSFTLSGFPLTSFHLAEVPRAILKNWKPLFCLPFPVKRCAGVKVELKLHYPLFRVFTFLCEQLSKNITNFFFIYNYSHF